MLQVPDPLLNERRSTVSFNGRQVDEKSFEHGDTSAAGTSVHRPWEPVSRLSLREHHSGQIRPNSVGHIWLERQHCWQRWDKWAISSLQMMLGNPSERIANALRKADSVARVARVAGVPKRSVQNVLDGAVPSVDRAEEICRALGLEFYIGPPRAPSRFDANLSLSDTERFDWRNSQVREPPGPPYNLTRFELFESVTDAESAELLARLADQLETASQAERVQLRSVVASVLDLASAMKISNVRGRSSV